mgnify:CR=1 FL=1
MNNQTLRSPQLSKHRNTTLIAMAALRSSGLGSSFRCQLPAASLLLDQEPYPMLAYQRVLFGHACAWPRVEFHELQSLRLSARVVQACRAWPRFRARELGVVHVCK